jgi:hypothetical protein
MTSNFLGHIVAMGGGGFSMEPDNPLLDDFVLSLSRRHPARVCFIPTASADSPSYIVNFYRAFTGRCIPTDLTLFDSPLLRRHPARNSELAAFVGPTGCHLRWWWKHREPACRVARSPVGRGASGRLVKRERLDVG